MSFWGSAAPEGNSASDNPIPRTPPCSRMAWAALVPRFISTCWISDGSASMVSDSVLMSRTISMVDGREARSNLTVSLMSGPRDRHFGSYWVFRLKARICLTRSLPRMPALSTCCMLRLRRVPFIASSIAISVKPTIAARILLKSWAMPPASVPIASILRACLSWFSKAISSVISRETPT